MDDLVYFLWSRCKGEYGFVRVPESYVEDANSDKATEWLPDWASPDLLPHFGMAVFSTPDREFIAPRGDFGAKEFYSPLKEDQALFRNFAALDGTIEAIIGFANKYGQPTDFHISEGEPRRPSEITAVPLWRNEILLMKRAVTLWEERRYSDLRGLFNNRCVNVAVQFQAFRPNSNASFPPSPAYQLVPDSLISAMWLQFARAVAANAKVRPCAVCSKWFRVGPGGSRNAHATVCSPRCRKAKSRRARAGTTPARLENARFPKPAGDAKGIEKKR